MNSLDKLSRSFNNSVKYVYKQSSYIKRILEWIMNMWENHRWEFCVIVSILALIICYFFTKQDKYKGIDYNQISNYTYTKPYSPRRVVSKKNEKECRRVLESIFKVPFQTVRPNFLKNPSTGKNLELDMYNQDLNLALEYQGAQHRVYTPFFHKRYSDFLDQLERDEYKKKKCKETGIDLICVPDTVSFDEIETYIINELYKLNRI